MKKERIIVSDSNKRLSPTQKVSNRKKHYKSRVSLHKQKLITDTFRNLSQIMSIQKLDSLINLKNLFDSSKDSLSSMWESALMEALISVQLSC